MPRNIMFRFVWLSSFLNLNVTDLEALKFSEGHPQECLGFFGAQRLGVARQHPAIGLAVGDETDDKSILAHSLPRLVKRQDAAALRPDDSPGYDFLPPPWLRSPPLRPASEAFSRSFAKLPPEACPPFLPASDAFSRSFAKLPGFLFPLLAISRILILVKRVKRASQYCERKRRKEV